MALRAGAIRFNTDSSQMEMYDGNQWTGILATSPELQTGGTRGLRTGGNTVDVIDYFNIDTTGNAIDFGNLTVANGSPAGASNQVRGIFAGGYLSPGNNSDRAQFITISSGGSAQDFGDMTISFNRADGLTDSHGGLGGF